jgi:hypothetical protein
MSERREELEELEELLVRRTLEGLDEREARRLEALLEAFPEVDVEWADRLVGELDAATMDAGVHGVAPELKEALLDAAPRAAEGDLPRLRGVRGGSSATGAAPPDVPRQRRGFAGWSTWGGWALAAVLAGLLLVRPDSASRMEGAPGGAPSGASVAVEGAMDGGPDADFLRVATAEDAVSAAWAPGGHAAGDGVSGEVVWSSLAQAGVMRFAGLAPNPTGLQYQLWIFDAQRDERFPVDGGVFDVPPGGGVVEVPVDARLPVAKPTLFAVTLETAGGVVVSDRTRLATVATVGD